MSEYHKHVCRLCHIGALGDERRITHECPALADLREQFPCADCSGVMARAITSLHALIKRHPDGEQTLFHPPSLPLELWVMGGTCSWSALLMQISETSTLHWLQSAQVSWLGLCGPETSPWSAGTSLLASIECHADERERERISLVHSASIGL